MKAVAKNTKEIPALLPDRHPTADFFVCDILDAIPKDDMASMEHPIFSLSTRPDTRVHRYVHNEVTVEVTPSVKGLATIHDKDILIYCISQIVAKMNNDETPSQTVHLKAHDLLVATNRETSGDGYRRLREAFERLKGTQIVTNIETDGEETTHGFGLIDFWEIVRKTKEGRMISVSIKLSDWMYRSVVSKQVLTLHRDYFRLRKPLERRVYEIARKHCGQSPEWRIKLANLQNKCGSNSPIRVFRAMLRKLVEYDHLPDYAVTMSDDLITFKNRGTMAAIEKSMSICPPLDPETYHDARSAAPGWDIYHLEQEWREWMSEAPRHPDKAFIGFCRKWFERKGTP